MNPLGRASVLGLKDIVRLVEDDLGRVEEVFRSQVRSDVPLVGEIGRYVQEGGGKRVRPALLLLASRLCGYRGERAVTLASTVEFIHTASLLHDDIIDEATTRRGRRSVNSRWGNDITVLLGDFLYTKAMAMALSQDNLRIMRLLSDVTLRLIEGEILEIERNGNMRATVDEHVDTIRRKTADLFAACTQIGAILGAVGDEREAALAGYGLNLGLCFQMVDDLLDFTAEEKTLGKPVANDLREGKVTLPMIFLLQRGGRAAEDKVKAVLEDRAFARVTRDDLVRLARDCGALDEARGMAERYADEARANLIAFEPSPYREALDALPGFILARDH
ncbi:MAG TPA: polyprenyl synthetase family protein [Vicinamibacteria bacterium]|nr:polyprenyl synthetase family protein [Vicinamibacteria bacterium]